MADRVKGKDNLVYTKTAIKLADELLLRTTDKNERRPIIVQQIHAYKKLDTLLFESGQFNPDQILTHAQHLLTLNTVIGDKKGIAEQYLNIANFKLYILRPNIFRHLPAKVNS